MRKREDDMTLLTQHDQPLGLCGTLGIVLGVTELSNVDRVGLVNLISSAMSNENGLSTPLDGHVASLRDGAKINLDLGKSQDISRGRHVGQKVGHSGLGSDNGQGTGGTDHEVGEGTVGRITGSALVLAKVGDVGGVASRGVVETLLNKRNWKIK